jgi:putative copper resistance protein D
VNQFQFLFIGILYVSLFTGPLSPGHAEAQQNHEEHGTAHTTATPDHGHSGHVTLPSGWEGSEAGVAYSERNHHIAGWLVILMGVAELSHALRISLLSWARFLLPAAMTCTGVFLLVWSDHEAWPIGKLSFGETFFGQDHEILQHKAYGLLALFVGAIELVRRLGHMGRAVWATPLPLMAIIGGLMLFGHSHGAHPAAQKIAIHHAIMGTLAVTAGSSKLWSGWSRGSKSGGSKWELLWAGLILVIGAQLLIYSE